MVGAAFDQASAKLSAAGFTVVRVEAVSAKPAGTVTGTSPAAGTQAAKGARVTVTVAKPDPAMTTMPDLRGLPPAQGIAKVEAAGLVIDPVWRAAYVKPGLQSCLFWSTEPVMGTPVKKGSLVALHYTCG